MAAGVGAVAAAAFLAYRLVVVDSYRLTPGTLGWWLLRLAVEGAIGALGGLLVRHGPIGGVDKHVQWVVAGIIAPIVLLHVRFGDRATQAWAIDLQDIYDRLRVPVDQKLAAATAASDGLGNEDFASGILNRGGDPEGLAQGLIASIQAYKALETKANDAAYVHDTAHDPSTDDHTKLLVIIAKARELGMLRVVRRYRRSLPRTTRRRSDSS